MTDVLSPALIDGFAVGLLQGGRSLHDNLSTLSRALYGALLAMSMLGFALHGLLEGMVGDQLGQVVSRLLRFILVAGLVQWLLDAYDLVFYDGLYRSSEALAQAVAGPSGAGQSFSTAWNVFLELILSTFQMVKDQVAANLGATLYGLLSWSVYAFMMAVAIGVFALAMVVFAVIHVMGGALVGLALALGPFFIPWLLWAPGHALFAGWLRFLVTACLYKVVAVTLMVMARPVFTQLAGMLDVQRAPGAAPADPLHTLALGLGFVVVAAILAYLMKNVPQIAASLLSGSRIDTGFARSTSRSIESRLRHAGDRMFKRPTGRVRSYRAQTRDVDPD